jgi:hypothetical protein
MPRDFVRPLTVIFLTSLPFQNNLSTRVRLAVFTKLRDCETVNLCLPVTFSRLTPDTKTQTADGYIFTNILENKLASNLEDIPLSLSIYLSLSLSPHTHTHTHTYTHTNTHSMMCATNLLGHTPTSLGVIKSVNCSQG